VVRPLVIGHRGASAARPENTVEAFVHAAELGADWVELDVRRTADDALVIHHDAVLPDGRTIVELAASDLPPSIASFDEAMAACAGMGVNIEIKNVPDDPDYDPDERVAHAVADWLLGGAAGDPVDLTGILVTSFSPRTVGVVRERSSAVPTGQLVFDLADAARWVDRAAAAGHVAINPWHAFVDEAFMALTRAAGLRVYPWTVDDPARMQVLVDLGVDGIITNVPDIARTVVDA